MKWFLLILVFIAGIYYLVSTKVKDKMEAEKAEQLKQEEVLPIKPERVYVMRFSRETLLIMRRLTQDANPDVRFAATELLWQMQDEQSPAIIKRMFEMEVESDVKLSLIKMLAREKTRINLHILGEALKNYDKKTKISAIQAIGTFANKEALPILNTSLNDYDEEVKIEALKAINSIRKDVELNKEKQLKALELKPIFTIDG
ncbi:MAG: HEAT repeat domain-containing protein [Elusimicrobiales bacterium]|nr:HEAT repeat domain-containing protein [Elusimicrobiales bacterium]MCK5582492.1 HEAT repeat domain-containing protein [Elusimicrobiales bacterium]